MSSEKIQTKKFVIREATLLDEQALRNLVAVPITTRGISMSFQREPSYFKASDVVYIKKLHVVIEDIEKKQIVACYSNGTRQCYINGSIHDSRYICDLRVDQDSRGKSLVKMLAQHVKLTMHNPNFSQLIIFEDNHAARAAIQTGKTEMPDYYNEGLIETFTMTGIKNKDNIINFLKNNKQNKKNSNPDEISIIQAQIQHIPLMNKFIQEMSNYFNFIPVYNFEDLLKESSFYRGLNISDFSLYFKNKKLVGMFGLWDQHSFKQTKVLNYRKLIQIIRPFYNLYADLTNNITIPKKGNDFKYHLLHTLLCDPEDLFLHNKMILDALNISSQNGIGVISFTLSHKDPRHLLNAYYKGEKLIGMHGFISFQQDPSTIIDEKIPYLEIGRI
jgi:hypothetical protein